MRKLLPIVLALLGLAAVMSPGHAEERPRVIALMTRSAGPYGSALDGLREGLAPHAELDVQKIDPEDVRDAERIRMLAPELLVTVGSQATSWAIDQTERVPIVFLMVLNPVSSGLVPSMKKPGGRVTGASLDIPPAVQFRVLRELLGVERVAVLFNRQETGQVVDFAQRVAERGGIELVPIPVMQPKDLSDALRQVDDSFDALWSVADRTVIAHGAGEKILLHTLRERIPFMGISEFYVRAGALLALATSYEENGRQAAELALRILRGESPRGLAVSVPSDIEVVFNPLTAERLELTLSSTSGLKLRAVQ